MKQVGPDGQLKGVSSRGVLRLGAGARAGKTDLVAVEEPLEIRVDGETVAITMRTPGDDQRLALGFLLSEGLIETASDVSSIAPCGRPGEEGYGNVIDVRSVGGRPIEVERVLESRRFTTTTSACGVCGRQSIDDLLGRCRALDPGPVLAPWLLTRAVASLRDGQPNFERTGGIHAAALLDATGRMLVIKEDVGRHNAVDKVVGALLGGLDGKPLILAVSGRASFEIVQKATVARIPVVASVSAASSLAVDLAERMGITLAAFVRDASANVYTHPERLQDGILASDDEDGSFTFMPLAARRALDVAGIKLSLESWQRMSLEGRRALVSAGATEQVDPSSVEALCRGAPRIPPLPDPDPRAPPSGLDLEEAVWRGLPGLYRSALARLFARGRGDKLARLLAELPRRPG